jgi:hypothetical protein
MAFKTLNELKKDLVSDKPNVTLNQVLKKIDALVELEAKKNETVGTISRLLKFSKEK